MGAVRQGPSRISCQNSATCPNFWNLSNPNPRSSEKCLHGALRPWHLVFDIVTARTSERERRFWPWPPESVASFLLQSSPFPGRIMILKMEYDGSDCRVVGSLELWPEENLVPGPCISSARRRIWTVWIHCDETQPISLADNLVGLQDKAHK